MSSRNLHRNRIFTSEVAYIIMSEQRKFLISVSAAAAAVFLLVFFRSVPSGSLWKGYRIVYAAEECSENDVMKFLSDAGCRDIVNFSSQTVPLGLSPRTPEVSLAAADADSSGYLSKRDNYFFDRSGKYRVYYIPERNVKEAEKAAAAMDEAGISAGIDTQTGYPFIVPAVCVLFAVFLCIVSVHPIVTACGSVLPVLFSFCMPFYAGGAAVCLFLYALYLAQQVWGRSGAFMFVLKYIPSVLFAGAAAAVAVFSSLKGGLLFIAAAAGTCGALNALRIAEKRRDGRYSFVPVMIRPAGMTQIFTVNARRAVTVCASAICLLIAGSLLFGRINASGEPDIQLPSSHGGGIGGNLPSLDDYVSWCWNAETLPYRSIAGNDSGRKERKPKDGDTVVFPAYEDSAEGITETDKKLVYDGSYRAETLMKIDSLQFPAVEKVLKEQGKASHAGYASSGSGGGGAGSMLLMTLALAVPVFFMFYARRKSRKEIWSRK